MSNMLAPFLHGWPIDKNSKGDFEIRWESGVIGDEVCVELRINWTIGINVASSVASRSLSFVSYYLLMKNLNALSLCVVHVLLRMRPNQPIHWRFCSGASHIGTTMGKTITRNSVQDTTARDLSGL